MRFRRSAHAHLISCFSISKRTRAQTDYARPRAQAVRVRCTSCTGHSHLIASLRSLALSRSLAWLLRPVTAKRSIQSPSYDSCNGFGSPCGVHHTHTGSPAGGCACARPHAFSANTYGRIRTCPAPLRPDPSRPLRSTCSTQGRSPQNKPRISITREGTGEQLPSQQASSLLIHGRDDSTQPACRSRHRSRVRPVRCAAPLAQPAAAWSCAPREAMPSADLAQTLRNSSRR